MTSLGIDLGTSGLRALLVEEGGSVMGATERHFGVANPHPSWSEQDPADWIAALEAAVDELRQSYEAFSTLSGIGVSGHMHGATLLGKDDTVLRPCILWNDTRAHAEAKALDQTPGVRETSGNIGFPGFTAPKLAWVRNHEPEIFRQVSKVLLPAAFLNHYLTGDYVADMSDSAGTSWLDVGERQWSETLLEAGNMDSRQMPRLVEGCAPAGQLRDSLRSKWGLNQSVTVAGGAGDNAAAACGIGALNEGEGFVSLGTSGVLLAARDGYYPDPDTAVHTFCHAVPERWYQMGVMLAATDNLNWLSRIVGVSVADLARSIEGPLQAPGGVLFLPYLSGERTPHNDANIRGSFSGLSTATTREDMTIAVMEGVAFGLRDSFDALRATRANLEHVFAIGGGSATRTWLEMIATIFDIPVSLPASSELGAAYGAARLGRLAASGAKVEDVITPPAISETIDPVPSRQASFEEAYQRFRTAYPAIKSIQ